MTQRIAIYYAPFDENTTLYMEVGENFMEILHVNESDQVPNHPNAFWIDAEALIVVADSLYEALRKASVIMIDCMYARYKDGVESGYEEMTSCDRETWMAPYLKMMRDLDENCEPTLQEWLDDHYG